MNHPASALYLSPVSLPLTERSSKLVSKTKAALESHLLLDSLGRVFPQGQLGSVGQSLLHCQITQQVIALEKERTTRSRTLYHTK